MPFAAIVATLREVGFDGVLSVECRLRGEPHEAVRECGRYLRGLLAGREQQAPSSAASRVVARLGAVA